MTELLFYHIEQTPLGKVLPMLLEKTLERGWRAVVEFGSAERMQDMDLALWTYRDDSFLPHAMQQGENDAEHPVLLTTNEDNSNNAAVRFFVDRALPRADTAYERLVFLFDGHDPDAIAEARGAWKTLKDQLDCTYWQQDTNGRWVKKA